jgi:Na+/proline symporter/signal transduction histidine kinase
MTPQIVLSAVFIYITLLFGIARWGDRLQFVENAWPRNYWVYALALGVYCTSWTFYGLVGTASVNGWSFLPILLGPMLLFTIGYPILERIRRLCNQEHIHSIADFLASRYGKRQGVSATVTLVVLLVTIPYIALQLKAVSDMLSLTLGEDFLANQDLTFVISITMIGFALLFGARRLDVSGYHSGLMATIAFESLIKIIMILVIAFFALSLLDEIPEIINVKQVNFAWQQPPSMLRFSVETLISMCAIFCLPRMFHVTFVECLSKENLKSARWIFTAYLAIICVCIFIIAWVGNLYFYDKGYINGDSYVIALPLLKESNSLALIAFLGGFSAATAMIIVATVTLSQMLSNDVILPLLVRRRINRNLASDFSRSLIIARRLTVVLVVLCGYVYQSILAENVALTSIGLIAFALVVQLAPGILFGLYWRKGNARGLYAGLIVGLVLWFYTIMMPLLHEAGLIDSYIMELGLFEISWLRPENLLGLTFADSYTRGVLLSLIGNVLFYLWYSLTSTEHLADRIQAAAFTDTKPKAYEPHQDINLNDLHALMEEFLGDITTKELFADFKNLGDKEEKTRLIEKAQRALAGTVGVASSQAIIKSLYSGKTMAVEEVVNLFGETTKALRFNKEVLFSSFENISSGISVVDEGLNLIAWNNRYELMFDYPSGMLRVGLHVSDIMRYNGERGMLGDGNIDEMIRKRLSLMSTGNKYRVVRYHSEDTIIEIKGRPLPNGGYVTTYDDITEFIQAQRQLQDVNANLENRVQERTKTIEKINQNLVKEIERRNTVENELRHAKKVADEVNASKTKFIALASHDIMQPLNAANLYVNALLESKEYRPGLTIQLKNAIENTESIISSLLEISRLDNKKLEPKLEAFALNEFLANLVREAKVQRPEGIEIRYSPTSLHVVSDKHYLRRILQNFISNAVKYTHKGKVLVGCRRHAGYFSLEKGYLENDKKLNGFHTEENEQVSFDAVEICVYDNGPGIPEQEQLAVFDDFYRSNRKQQKEEIPGVGLGLAVVMRFSELLNHPVRCQSTVGEGSCFSVFVPTIEEANLPDESPQLNTFEDQITGLHILHVDDDQQNLLATSTLLTHWECLVNSETSIDDIEEYVTKNPAPDILLMDYQLGDSGVDGISLAKNLLAGWEKVSAEDKTIPVCIISATTDIDLPGITSEIGFDFMSKPVKPARLRALLTQMAQRQ